MSAIDANDEEWDEIAGLLVCHRSGKQVHWNEHIPGRWKRHHSLKAKRRCQNSPGVYRLVALSENGEPAPLFRLCGKDLTGTLYIGAEGRTFALGSRVHALVNSLLPKRRGQHVAGLRLRRHATLSDLFPTHQLAVTWCYSQLPMYAEGLLFETYFASFGDHPPLNFRVPNR